MVDAKNRAAVTPLPYFFGMWCGVILCIAIAVLAVYSWRMERAYHLIKSAGGDVVLSRSSVSLLNYCSDWGYVRTLLFKPVGIRLNAGYRNVEEEQEILMCIQTFRSIETLQIHGYTLSHQDVTGIIRNNCITTLDLSGCQLPAGIAAVVRSKGGLEFLSVSGSNLTDQELANLLNVSSLERVFFDDTSAGIYVCNAIFLAHSVKHVSLKRSKVNDAGCPLLASSKHLEILDLSYTDVTCKGTDVLMKSKSLQLLVLTGCPVSRGCIERCKAKWHSGFVY